MVETFEGAPLTPEQKKQRIKEMDNARIEQEEARGYDYSGKPESYSSWQWCGQCNRSLMSFDDETCDCLDDEEG